MCPARFEKIISKNCTKNMLFQSNVGGPGKIILVNFLAENQ